ncbi:SURF1 family protein [Brevundimonas sp. AJA228-03]|uniref:SURF1 family protein n=1 Tax=Brevundimonas sp. AJA228-03 TaxID=2752515 RepID=UPI001ADF4631|nr:SURF1 family cytochrome oxidase biogenesis protein [Brevundimonas sp. AJA228-03]QTN19489.1 SURF1 family protein [Brevundimonas sp. AJA228-03]
MTDATSNAPRFPILLTAFIAVCVAILCALGTWQVQRLTWKEGLIDRADAAALLAPAPLAEVLTATDPEFRKALVVCRGLPTAAFVELQSIHDGEPGRRLVSACVPEGMTQTFLVDRGFLPDAVTERPRVMASTLPLAMVVELRRTPLPGPMIPAPSQGRFFGRDSAAMAAALGAATPSGFTLYALSSSNPEIPALIATAPPAAFSNNHLGYAMTWFGLALALIGFYVAVLVRRRRKTLS